MKQILADNLKNLRGWRTPRKMVAFAVDDYANVRVASTKARQRLIEAGLDLSSQMDRYDALETRQDLEALFEVLGSVRDSQEQSAAFTAYSLSANPDFARIRSHGEQYESESVPDTFARLAAEQPDAYEGAWDLWCDGVKCGLIRPQFHGREHLNVDLFEHKLRTGSHDLAVNIEHACLAGLSGDPAMPGVGFSHAFGLHDESALPRQHEVLADGLDRFERVWGFRSTSFTPPAMQLHPSLFDVAVNGGVRAIDKPLRFSRVTGNGQRRRENNHSGRQRGQNHITVVRNVVFEPGKDMGFEPVSRALQQIGAAFRWRRPAIISSHRVNFCGHLDEANRSQSLDSLSRLLAGIIERWPEVEFVTVDRIVEELSPAS